MKALSRILPSIIPIFALSSFLYGQGAPPDTLYNQTLTPSGGLQTSSHFSQGGFPTTYSCNGADDFICTQQWKITQVLALGGFYNGSQYPHSFHISIYADDNMSGDLTYWKEYLRGYEWHASLPKFVRETAGEKSHSEYQSAVCHH